jgi:hypothetical protein
MQLWVLNVSRRQACNFLRGIPEIDIWRAANLMVKRYGDKALEESSSRADELTAGGDHQGADGRILQIYFSVAHDPTELNRQGPDLGTQYRSAIFPTNPQQERIAEAYIAQLNQTHAFDAPVVTKIEPDRAFYPAEDYHQDFLARNLRYPYIVINDLPKIENLKRLFPELYRTTPVLVAATTRS